jgi:hypothetical protein
MKLSLFKKLIREVIREELDYKFSRLEKKLNEVIDSSNSTDLLSASPNTTQVKETKKLPKVPVPSAGNSVLNEILAETASNDDWKKIEQETVPVESVQDKTSNLPEHLQEAFNKNYTEVMDKVEEKARFKSGA